MNLIAMCDISHAIAIYRTLFALAMRKSLPSQTKLCDIFIFSARNAIYSIMVLGYIAKSDENVKKWYLVIRRYEALRIE